MENVAGDPRFEGGKFILDANGQAESYDARFLISTLLVIIAKGDGHISDLESQKMIDLLSARFNLRSPVALERLSSAVMALANDAGVEQKLREISEGLSIDEKREVFKMMLEVAAVDGAQDPDEIGAINLASGILGMSQEAIHAAYDAYFSTG